MQLTDWSRVTSAAFRGDRLRPETWIERRGEELRALPGRRVYRAESGGLPVVVKEYAPGPIARRLRSYADAEADAALEAARRGVPTVEPLACARLADGRQILLLRDEEGALPLREVVQRGLRRGAARHELARRVGEMLARIQNAGIRHTDLHSGNLLVRPDGSLVLADARGLRFGPYLRVEARADGLADFALFFLTHASRIDLLNFWGAYARASEFTPEEAERVRHILERRIPRAFRRVTRGRTRKWLRAARRVQVGPFTGFAAPAIHDTDLERAVALAAERREGPCLLKRSRTAWTFLLGEEFVVKSYLPKKALAPLRAALLGTRPERALRAEQALTHRGLGTPRVVAVLREGRFPARSILVMSRERAGTPIAEAFAGLPAAQARDLAARVGRTLRRMHDWGLRHRDLKGSNLWWDPESRRIRFLDLDGVREGWRPLPWKLRAKDLGRLAASILDRRAVPTGLRLRCLDAYLGGETPPGFAPGKFAMTVTRRAQEFRRRKGVAR